MNTQTTFTPFTPESKEIIIIIKDKGLTGHCFADT